MISLFSLFLFFRTEIFFKNMNQINTHQTCSMCFPKQKTVSKTVYKHALTQLFFLSFFFFFFWLNFLCLLQFEQKRGHVASAVECYMNQYGVSEEQAYNEFQKQIENGWLDINQEWLKPTAVPMPILDRVLTLTRTADVFYKEQDEYTHVGKAMKGYITSLFINPIT